MTFTVSFGRPRDRSLSRNYTTFRVYDLFRVMKTIIVLRQGAGTMRLGSNGGMFGSEWAAANGLSFGRVRTCVVGASFII